MKTAILEKVRNAAHALGINNKPTYVVMAIAAVKGICRPAFTMMDKKEDPKTKKYTAIREGLTEIIAIPVYWALGELSAKVATKKSENKLDITSNSPKVQISNSLSDNLTLIKRPSIQTFTTRSDYGMKVGGV